MYSYFLSFFLLQAPLLLPLGGADHSSQAKRQQGSSFPALASFPWIYPRLEKSPTIKKLAGKGLKRPETSHRSGKNSGRAAETRSTCVEGGSGSGGPSGPSGPSGPRIDPRKQKAKVILRIQLPPKKR